MQNSFSPNELRIEMCDKVRKLTFWIQKFQTIFLLTSKRNETNKGIKHFRCDSKICDKRINPKSILNVHNKHIYVCCLHRYGNESKRVESQSNWDIRTKCALMMLTGSCDVVDKGFESLWLRANCVCIWMNLSGATYCIHRWLNTWIAHCSFFFFLLSKRKKLFGIVLIKWDTVLLI